MKEIILSADGDSVVYSVPDEVADNLRSYCMEFSNKWIWEASHAEKYRHTDEDGLLYVAYSEEDFIEYLNNWIFPSQHSVFVKNLGWTELEKNLPLKYQSHPYFNF